MHHSCTTFQHHSRDHCNHVPGSAPRMKAPHHPKVRESDWNCFSLESTGIRQTTHGTLEWPWRSKRAKTPSAPLIPVNYHKTSVTLSSSNLWEILPWISQGTIAPLLSVIIKCVKASIVFWSASKALPLLLACTMNLSIALLPEKCKTSFAIGRSGDAMNQEWETKPRKEEMLPDSEASEPICSDRILPRKHPLKLTQKAIIHFIEIISAARCIEICAYQWDWPQDECHHFLSSLRSLYTTVHGSNQQDRAYRVHW